MDNYKKVPRSELMDIATEWGIKNPTQKSDKMLEREIHGAHCIQFMYENGSERVPEEFEMNMRRKFDVKWSDGIELRKIGCDFKTLRSLVKANIHSLEQFTIYTKSQLVDEIGLAPAYATLITNKYPTLKESSLSEALRKLNMNQKRKLNRIEQQIKERYAIKKYSNQELQSYVKGLENDLAEIDSIQSQWKEMLKVLLDDAKNREEDAALQQEIRETIILSSTITPSQMVAARCVVILKKYDPKSDPQEHFRIWESALAIVLPDADMETIALLLLMSLPFYMKKEIIPFTLNKLDLEKIKSQIIGMWHRNRSPSMGKRPRTNGRIPSTRFNGMGHTSDRCWVRHTLN